MRSFWIALPLMLAPVPAVAAPPQASQIPPELSDPAMADKLTRMLVPLSRALMDMPVGEIEAAAQGREPTAADRAKRVRDEIGGPEEQRQIEAGIAAAGPKMQAMQKALVASLPGLLAAFDGVEKQLERATANIPDPTYPKR
ncbi:MAG TPA: hypothetical protein VL336_08900 [Sphingomicrobium sp.]|nr:hypothetical protein [Sphingomicrobium sp.]